MKHTTTSNKTRWGRWVALLVVVWLLSCWWVASSLVTLLPPYQSFSIDRLGAQVGKVELLVAGAGGWWWWRRKRRAG